MQRWSAVKKQNAQKFAALVCLLGLTACWIFTNLWFQEGDSSLVKTTIEPVSQRWDCIQIVCFDKFIIAHFC